MKKLLSIIIVLVYLLSCTALYPHYTGDHSILVQTYQCLIFWGKPSLGTDRVFCVPCMKKLLSIIIVLVYLLSCTALYPHYTGDHSILVQTYQCLIFCGKPSLGTETVFCAPCMKKLLSIIIVHEPAKMYCPIPPLHRGPLYTCTNLPMSNILR